MNAVGHTSQYDFPQAHLRDRSRAWLWTRMAVAYGLLEGALWTAGEAQKIVSMIFLAWVIATTIADRPSWNELGLGLKGMRGASVALVYTAIAFALMVGTAWWFGTLRSIDGQFAFSHAAGYVLWSFVQEFILNSFFFLTLKRLLDRRKAVWGTVFLFVFAHIPNPVLMAATLILSAVFVPLFRRYRNIYPLGLGHAILGLTIAITVPDRFLAHMRVGLGYVHFFVK
ncbi:MAG: CPBP family glutamic-type intramembrane protease [Terriglobales bacterium]